jgi:FKBP-type peptidyl-prolyl cis-trans isomerase
MHPLPLSSSVSMKYVGKLEDGTVFDESERFKFTIGAGEVIKVVPCQPTS